MKHTQSHPPLNRSPPLLLLLFNLWSNGCLLLGMKILARISFTLLLSPSDCCHAKSTVVVKVSVSDQCVKQWQCIQEGTNRRIWIFYATVFPLFVPDLAIRMHYDPVWVNKDRRPGPLTLTSPAWHATARRLCYWASSAILAWSEKMRVIGTTLLTNTSAIRVCFRDTKNTKATTLWMVWCT